MDCKIEKVLGQFSDKVHDALLSHQPIPSKAERDEFSRYFKRAIGAKGKDENLIILALFDLVELFTSAIDDDIPNRDLNNH